MTEAKKSTIKNLIHGWRELQTNPKNCPTELNMVVDILTDMMEGKYNPCGTWRVLEGNLLNKSFVDAFNNKWSVSIDLMSKSNSTIWITVINEDTWREVCCVGKYNTYEIITKANSN
jgi:hypothetical protein